ncbi:flagellar basal body protein [Rhizobium sp. SL86]|uniref:flagellar basal body protein n=1 Tax=Rhizobium sp. SL86 TaxID=2995148 RepID=UPI002273C8FE|nr:flagellar basal body protein [Rhizobium sp. SL86]MCY1668647.1 flagellar basal body protein [Rhizobium sp. SL86]
MTISAVTTTALSGMQANTVRIATAANNIANADTIGYSPLSAQFSTAPTGGVQAHVTEDTTVPPDSTTIDLAGEMTDLIGASLSFKANAAVFETGADLWEALATIKRD